MTKEAATLDVSEIISTTSGAGGVSFVIRKTFQGGATGDTLHEAWICRRPLSDCQRAAIVDANADLHRLGLRQGRGATLLISATDAVWDYTNVVYGNDHTLLRLTITEIR